PVGGVGINLAIQDAVAAANILAMLLKKGPVSTELLPKVQERRDWADADDAVRADLHSEASNQRRARDANPAARALRGEAAQPLPVASPLAGKAHRHGLPPRARKPGNQRPETRGQNYLRRRHLWLLNQNLAR